jgi:hypothetical protein
MNTDKEAVPSGQWQVTGEGKEPDGDEGVPLSVRNARRMRRDLWPHLWMSFASIIILAVALAILSYRMGAQSCH